jgi:hypothetical protein
MFFQFEFLDNPVAEVVEELDNMIQASHDKAIVRTRTSGTPEAYRVWALENIGIAQ